MFDNGHHINYAMNCVLMFIPIQYKQKSFLEINQDDRWICLGVRMFNNYLNFNKIGWMEKMQN